MISDRCDDDDDGIYHTGTGETYGIYMEKYLDVCIWISYTISIHLDYTVLAKQTNKLNLMYIYKLNKSNK